MSETPERPVLDRREFLKRMARAAAYAAPAVILLNGLTGSPLAAPAARGSEDGSDGSLPGSDDSLPGSDDGSNPGGGGGGSGGPGNERACEGLENAPENRGTTIARNRLGCADESGSESGPGGSESG